ncbi:MAG TPA: DUF2799 domain-containing protein [Nevskiaceae bacterium]|nr:DUF2799 domain-containing protein [Nevskiaceae bacterium]
MKPYLALLLPAALLSGCATLSESECRTANWRDLGRADGQHGYEATRLGEHQDACGKYGIAPDAAAYQAGRDEGLRLYCTPQVALGEGRAGNEYHAVCPGDANLMFVRYYQRGSVQHQLDAEAGEIQQELDAQNQAKDATGDLGLYKMLEQNGRYLERTLHRVQGLQQRAQFDIDADRDPQVYASGRWRSDLPYPDARAQADKWRQQHQHDHDKDH